VHACRDADVAPRASFLASQLSVRQGKRKGGIAATFSYACAATDLTRKEYVQSRLRGGEQFLTATYFRAACAAEN
jgi:hypothetical protein